MSSYVMRTVSLLSLMLAIACTKSGESQGAKPLPEAGKGGEAAKASADSGADKAGEGKQGQGGGRRGRGGGGPASVRVVEASFQTLPRTYSAVSPLNGRRQADVFPRVAGRVSYIGPKEGEAVKVGEVLFKIDRNDPGETFLSTPVQSPITGWVGRWMTLNVGEQVSPTEPVVSVVDDSFLRATVYLSTSEWVAINSQAKVSVTINDVARDGRIVAIARAADASSGRGSVIIEVPNEKHDWRVGMIARVKIDLEPKQRMIIPSAALIVTDQGPFVFATEDGKAKRLAIKFNIVDSDRIEVTEGLKDKSQVVIAGANLLTDNAPVQIIQEQAQEKAH